VSQISSSPNSHEKVHSINFINPNSITAESRSTYLDIHHWVNVPFANIQISFREIELHNFAFSTRQKTKTFQINLKKGNFS
jgi:hypothetical protein